MTKYTIRDIEKMAGSTASCFNTDDQWQYIKTISNLLVEILNENKELKEEIEDIKQSIFKLDGIQ